MKVLFVVKGGPIVEGQLLNPGRIMEEGSRVYNQALLRIKTGIHETWNPLTRIVHCDIEDLEAALADMPDELRNKVCKGVSIKRALPEVLRKEVAPEPAVEAVDAVEAPVNEVVDVKVQALVTPEPIAKAMRVEEKSKGRKPKEV